MPPCLPAGPIQILIFKALNGLRLWLPQGWALHSQLFETAVPIKDTEAKV